MSWRYRKKDMHYVKKKKTHFKYLLEECIEIPKRPIRIQGNKRAIGEIGEKSRKEKHHKRRVKYTFHRNLSNT